MFSSNFYREHGVERLALQFTVYDQGKEDGEVFAELYKKDGDWEYHILILSTSQQQITIVDNRQRLLKEVKKGFFGFNLANIKKRFN